MSIPTGSLGVIGSLSQTGWRCPGCSRCYAPFISECSRCGLTYRTEINQTASAQSAIIGKCGCTFPMRSSVSPNCQACGGRID
jgi:hypothetical protein